MTELGQRIRERIGIGGPMRLDRYMAACVAAYYGGRIPFGAAGDFVTAPEVSQMFGELTGLWAAQVWVDQGRPDPFVLAELGPGRGTLMRDALRAGAALPGFRAAARVWLVETSATLRREQAELVAAPGAEWIGPEWTETVAGLPGGPLIVVANEFFDALPVRQFQRVDVLWRERQVAVRDGELVLEWGRGQPDAGLDARFPLTADGGVVEVSEAGEAVAAALGARIAADGGAALVIDYGGWEGGGDTLQAVRGHAAVGPLDGPGTADLTTQVRFGALAAAARPARAHGLAGQGAFLEALGITARAQALVRGRDAATAAAIAAAHRRLTHPEEMGRLFQVLALTPEAAPTPPGFGP